MRAQDPVKTQTPTTQESQKVPLMVDVGVFLPDFAHHIANKEIESRNPAFLSRNTPPQPRDEPKLHCTRIPPHIYNPAAHLRSSFQSVDLNLWADRGLVQDFLALFSFQAVNNIPYLNIHFVTGLWARAIVLSHNLPEDPTFVVRQ